jgi:UDP-glucose-4-epimerase GalE
MTKPIILVTGGAGYIGSHAVKALMQASFRPVVYDNLSTGHRELVTGGELIEGDLRDKARLDDVFKQYPVAAVMHFASHCYVGESWEDPYKYYHDNLVNALNLFGAMIAHKVKKFIFSSTCAVYGNPERIPISETHPLNPVNPYGHSKLFIEKMLRDFDVVYGLRYVSLRYFNAAGADPEGRLGEDHDPETHLIPRAFDAVLGRMETLRVNGDDYPTPDGTCVRDYIHVTDLAAAHRLALERLLAGGASDVFNLGTGQGFSIRQVIDQVEKTTGKNVPIIIGPRRPGDPPVLVADAQKAFTQLGWKPKYASIEQVIGTAWIWHRKRQPRINAD